MAFSRLRREAEKEREKREQKTNRGQVGAPVSPRSRLVQEAAKERDTDADSFMQSRMTRSTIDQVTNTPTWVRERAIELTMQMGMDKTPTTNNATTNITPTTRSVEELDRAYKEAEKREIEAKRNYVTQSRDALRRGDKATVDALMKAMEDAAAARALVEKEIEQKRYYDKYSDKTYNDDFFGQFGANMAAGRLAQDTDAAYSDYAKDPTEANRVYAEAMNLLEQRFQTNNAETLDDEGAVLPWITQSAAGYLPQFWDQTKATVGGAAAGALGGAGVGSVIPGLGTATGAVWGARGGAVAGSGAYSYNQMRGAAFQELLAAGLDEEAARAAANDEAVISALIEMADTGVDIATLGTGKLLSLLGKGGAKAAAKGAAKEAAESATKRFLKGVALYGANIGGEALEEGLQQSVSIANQNRDGTGIWDLAGSVATTLWDAARGENDEARAEILEAAGEGAKIAAMFGGVTRAATGIANTALEARTGRNMQGMGEDVVRAMIETGLESDVNTESHQLATQLKAKLDSGKPLSSLEVGRLQQANIRAIEAEQATRNATDIVQTEEETAGEADIQQDGETYTLERLAREAVAEREKAAESAPVTLEELARETVAEREKTAQTQAETVTAGNSRSSVQNKAIGMDDSARQAAIKKWTGYGDEGVKAFAEAVAQTGADPEVIRKGFQTAYETGLTGINRKQVELITPLQERAFMAGRLDYTAAQAKDAERTTTTAGAASGFDATGAPDSVTSTQRMIVDDLAKALGSRVVIGKSMGNAEINSRGDVVIADDFQTSVGGKRVSIVYHAAHEIGMHRLMQLAPTEGRAFMNAMYKHLSASRPDTAGTLAEIKQSGYAEQDVTLTTDMAIEEVVANTILSLYKDEAAFGEAIRKIAGGNDQQAKRGLNKFREILNDIVKKLKNIVAKVTGKEKDEAYQALKEVEHLRELYENALTEAVKKNNELTAQKNTTQESGVEYVTTADGLKYSLKMSFAEQVDAALNRELDRNTAVYVMNTPEMLQALGLKEYPMLITQRHIRDINHEKSPKNTHWHGLSEDTIKQMPDMIANPVMLLESATAGDVVVVSSVLDSDNFPVIISIHPDGNGHYNRAEIASNFVTSMYGRRGFGAFMETAIEKGRVLYVNKKRTRSLYSRVRLQLPKSLDRDGFIKDSIARQEDVVNKDSKNGGKVVSSENKQYSLRDSEGTTLTKSQQDFFKDSKARDKDGNLLMFYHGTQGSGFSVFDPEVSDDRTSLFFTTSLHNAASYSGTYDLHAEGTESGASANYAVYLNLEKPLILHAEDAHYDDVKFYTPEMKAMEERSNELTNYGYSLDKDDPRRADAFAESDGLLDALDEMDLWNGDHKDTRSIARWAKQHGYDGVILHDLIDYAGVMDVPVEPATVAIAFKSEQVKSATNKEPTSDPDIRYSLRDSTGKELTQEQAEYFKDSKERDIDGNLRVMYRGGNEDFTVFDRKKSSYANLYGRGFYFTASESHAKQYGDAKPFYLNVKTPISTREQTITRAQMRKFLKAVAENEDDYSFENYGYDATVDSVLRAIYSGKSDFAMLYDVSQTAIGDMVAAVELFNEVNGTEYDGLILDTETVIFRSEQAKNIDNLNPTSDPDVRFSLKDGASVEEMRARLEGIENKLAGMRKVNRRNFPSEQYAKEFDERRSEYQAEARKLRKEIKELSYPQVESAAPVDSKAFAAWFGDWKNGKGSKVVDPNGKPLVVYHGTGTTIEEFLPEFTGQGNDQYGSGFYFTTEKETAERYSGATLNGEEKPGGMDNPSVIPVYLNIRKPIVVDAAETPNLYDIGVSATMAARIIAKAPNIMHPEDSILGDYIEEYWERGPQRYMITRLAQEYDWTLGTLENDVFRDRPTEFRQAVKDVLGYDGVQVNFDSGEKHFVAWFPNQIKHATQNNGAFSKKDNRIMFSLREQNDLLMENAKLKEVNEALREQFKTTTFAQVGKKSLDKFTKQLLKDYQSGADIDEIRDALNGVYTYMANGEDGQSAAWNDLQERAYNVAVSILQEASTINDEMYLAYKGLRDRLRNYPISIDKRYDNDIQGYESINDFRKANFGRIKITNDGTPVDIVYADLANTYPEFFDESEYTTQADQLTHIADVLASLQPYEVNPYSTNMRQAATWLASDILERFYELPQAKPTFADKQAAKLTKQVIKDAKKLESLREKKNERIKSLIVQNREKVKATTQKEREKRVEAVKKVKDHYKAKEQKASESRKARELRAKIMRHAQDMSKKLLRPTDKQHIPQMLQGAVARLLESINLESNYTYDPNSQSYKKNDEGLPSKRTKAFAELKVLYEDMTDELVIDPDLHGWLDEIATMADKRIVDMTSEELETVYRALLAVESSVSSANKVFAKSRWASIEEAAESIREENKNKRQTTEYRGLRGFGQKLTGLDMMTPETYFHYLGESGDAIFRMMRNAQDKHIALMKSVEDFTHKELKNVPVKKWENEIKTVKLGGEDVQLTVAQIMELYVLIKRKQAQDHIFKGGILPESIETKGSKKITRAEPVRGIQIGEVNKAVSVLTEEQKKVAEKLQKFASTELSRWGNEAAMQVYNYEKFNEPVYWTIRTNRQEISSTVEKDTQVTSVAGRGFSKNTKPNANTSVKIGSIFDTFATHSSEMATYAAWLAPAEDINRIRNYTFLNEEGGRAGTVKGIIERVHGSRGTEYLQKLLSDIANGVGAGRGNETRMDKIVGNYKASAIGANLRVIIQQPTALLRALDMIDPQHVASVKNPLSGWKKAKKYAPIAQWKDWGYFDINTGRQMKDVLFETDSALEKVKQFTMAGAGLADSFSWGALWNAVENEVKATRKELIPDTEAFYKAVAARFTEIVDHTQVVDGILQRSQIMRSADGLTKMATSFMGEPTKQYNMAMSALYDFRYTEGKARTTARKRFGRTMTALVLSGVVNAAAQSIIDAVRDDDDEKEYWEKWLSAFFGLEGNEDTTGEKIKAVVFNSNLLNIFNPAGYIPYAKDVVSLFKGYDVSRMDMESIEKTISSWNNLWKAINGEGGYTIHGAAINFIGEAARLFGVPAANLKREITSFATMIAQETDSTLMQYRLHKFFTNVQNSSGGALDILYNAYMNDKDAYAIIYRDMIDSGVDPDKLASGMETRMKKAQGVEKVSELENRYMHPDQQSEYDNKMRSIQRSNAWKNANEKQRGKLEDRLYNIVSETDSGLEMMETIEEGAPFGLDEGEYLLYKLALEMVDQPNENGEYGTYTSAEKASAFSSAGLSGGEIAYLWGTDEALDAFGFGIDMEKYIAFKGVIGSIKADKDRRGNSISGSRKRKIEAYLRQLGVSKKEYLFLMGTVSDSVKDSIAYKRYFGG